MCVPFVDLKGQYLSIKPEIDAAISEVLASTAFIGGTAVTLFEQEFASWIGVPHAVSCANGTEAIEIALRALGVSAGDEVIVPANTFFATAEAVSSAGARVVFADAEPHHYTLDPEDFRRKITSRTRAVIPVHLYGHPADMDAISRIAREHNLLVIEDSSQAHGALYKGMKVGSMGDAGTFSFYPGKNLGAYGDGGAMVFRDRAAAEFARTYANHGSVVKYQHTIEGRNSRLDGLQAAVLRVKLRHIDAWNRDRCRAADRYSSMLAGVDGVTLPTVADGAQPVWHLYVVRVPERAAVAECLAERGVSTGTHYPVALPYLSAYNYLDHTPQDFPVASSQMGELLSLPMYPEITEGMIDRTVKCLQQATPAMHSMFNVL